MLSTEEVKHIALLARVGLTEAEEQKFGRDLSAVLEWFTELSTLDTEKIEPIGHITGRTDAARPDEVLPSSEEMTAAIRKNFPESKNGFLKVRSVF